MGSKLLLPRVLAQLTNAVKAGEPGSEVGAKLLPKLHRAEKFVFDTGLAGNEAEEMVFRETAVNMLEAGIFHLPFPEIWLEDPFEGSNLRYMYFCEEDEREIRIWFFLDATGELDIVAFPEPLIIDLHDPQDRFIYPAGNPQNIACKKAAGEAVYAVKKFIVTLGSRGAERRRVKGGNHALNMKPRGRDYPHTVVRIPTDYSSPVERDGKGTGGFRRMHLVRGYMWGKNTRDLNEQRWIEPFFRGRAELGEVVHDHYVMG